MLSRPNDPFTLGFTNDWIPKWELSKLLIFFLNSILYILNI